MAAALVESRAPTRMVSNQFTATIAAWATPRGPVNDQNSRRAWRVIGVGGRSADATAACTLVVSARVDSTRASTLLAAHAMPTPRGPAPRAAALPARIGVARDRPIFSIITCGTMVSNPRCGLDHHGVHGGERHQGGHPEHARHLVHPGPVGEQLGEPGCREPEAGGGADRLTTPTGTRATRTMTGTSSGWPVARRREMVRTSPVVVPRPPITVRMLKMAMATTTTPASWMPSTRLSTTSSTKPDAAS